MKVSRRGSAARRLIPSALQQRPLAREGLSLDHEHSVTTGVRPPSTLQFAHPLGQIAQGRGHGAAVAMFQPAGTSPRVTSRR